MYSGFVFLSDIAPITFQDDFKVEFGILIAFAFLCVVCFSLCCLLSAILWS